MSFSYKIKGNCFHKRVLFSPDIQQGQKGVRIYSAITAAFLKCFGKKIEKVTTSKGKVLYLDKKSLDKWLSRNSTYLTDSPTLPTEKIATICLNFKKNKLQGAIQQGDLHSLKTLKQLDENTDDLTMFYEAILNHHPEIVDWFLANGLKLEHQRNLILIDLLCGDFRKHFPQETSLKFIREFCSYVPDFPTIKTIVGHLLKKVNYLDLFRYVNDAISSIDKTLYKNKRIEYWPLAFFLRVMIYSGIYPIFMDREFISNKDPELLSMIDEAILLNLSMTTKYLDKQFSLPLPEAIMEMIFGYCINDLTNKLTPEEHISIATLCSKREEVQKKIWEQISEHLFADVVPTQPLRNLQEKSLSDVRFRVKMELRKLKLFNFTGQEDPEYKELISKNPMELNKRNERAESLFEKIADYAYGDTTDTALAFNTAQEAVLTGHIIRKVTAKEDTPSAVSRLVIDYLRDDLKEFL